MRTIHVAHSPDSDDAFMFYALTQGKLDTGGLKFVHQFVPPLWDCGVGLVDPEWGSTRRRELTIEPLPAGVA